MARPTAQFVCQNCGAISSRWQGRCDDCGEWNTLVEEAPAGGVAAGPGTKARKGRVVALTSLAGETAEAPRVKTGIAEFDRVTGGGFVRGSTLLVGGDPGIGKSTLLLQAAGALAQSGRPVVYVSGEEAIAQIRLRAERLGLAQAPVKLAAETSVEDILATLARRRPPASSSSIRSRRCGPTSPIRRRARSPRCAPRRRRSSATPSRPARRSSSSATSPRTARSPARAWSSTWSTPSSISRAKAATISASSARSRTASAPTDEIGVFEMTGAGLSEVANPSELFLGERNAATPGAAVFAGMEGTRPLLVEIQALVAPTALGTPRRAVIGWDQSRLAMVLAVLEAHCGVRLGDCDVYLNVAGGLRITEPAADLAVAAALVSSRLGVGAAARLRLFRRGQPVRRGAAGRPCAGAPEGGAEARLLAQVLPAASLAKDAGGSAGASGVAQLADLVAMVAPAEHQAGAGRRLKRRRIDDVGIVLKSMIPLGNGHRFHYRSARPRCCFAATPRLTESC